MSACAAWANTGGASPVAPMSIAPACMASSSGGPNSNSSHFTSMPSGSSNVSKARFCLAATSKGSPFCSSMRNCPGLAARAGAAPVTAAGRVASRERRDSIGNLLGRNRLG